MNEPRKKSPLLFWFVVVPALALVCCACLYGLVSALSPAHQRGDYGPVSGYYSSGTVPSGGTCENAGKFYASPFQGWPLGEWRVCDWKAISALYCSPYYFNGKYVHWGMDFASVWGEGAENIYRKPVVATGYAVVHQTRSDGNWNYGMGNYVQIQAVDPICEEEYSIDLNGNGVLDDGYCQYGCETDFSYDLNEDGRISSEFCGQELNWLASYFHLDEAIVQEKQFVRPGDILGYVDNSGNSTGNHLHYQINNGQVSFDGVGAIDPLPTLGCGWAWEEGIQQGK